MTNNDLLNVLRKDAITHAWPIQDLTRWPERCKVFTSEEEADGPAFLLISGHPACRECPAVIMGGNPENAPALLKHLPKPPFIIRETSATFRPILEKALPKAIIYPEIQMVVTRDSFKRAPAPQARRLTVDDALALATFFGNPASAPGMGHWLRGATVYGVLVNGAITAIGSTMVELPDVWVLVSIETQREQRRKGYGTQVTSALTDAGLKKAPVVSLTVHSENAKAIGLYEKLGYRRVEDRIWVDNGANFGPSPE